MNATTQPNRRIEIAPLSHRKLLRIVPFLLTAVVNFGLIVSADAQVQPPVATPTEQTGTPGLPIELSGMDLETRDHVQLSATFYPGFEHEDTIPIILLHDYEGSRLDFQKLAEDLVPKGYALMMPDLRGHGESTTQRIQHPRTGAIMETEIDADDFGPPDFQRMRSYDMQVIRRYLLEQNNEGKLNLNRLVLVGAGTGANIAMEWAVTDWISAPNYPGIKQSCDVKGIVLLSPYMSSPGFRAMDSARHEVLQEQIAIFIGVGKRHSRRSDAERIMRLLQGPSVRGEEPDNRIRLISYDTKEQAEELTKDPRIPFSDHLEQFINTRVVEGFPDAVWMEHYISSSRTTEQ
jgi:pimeloyl-ACP methyl ester carboxylesterase